MIYLILVITKYDRIIPKVCTQVFEPLPQVNYISLCFVSLTGG